MYIIDVRSNQRVKVEINKIIALASIRLSDFAFDWTNETEYEIYVLRSNADKQELGLISVMPVPDEFRVEIRLLEIVSWNVGSRKKYERIAGILIAHACRVAFDLGFYGFVSLIPKTQLIEHYKMKYGFRQYGKHLALEMEASVLLMNQYLVND